jgi:hypothetical protein
MASKSPLKKYTSYLTYAGVGLAVISSLGQYFWTTHMHLLWPILLLFIIGVQWLVFAFVSKFGQHKTNTMLKQYQIAKYTKLFIYMIVLAVYVFAVKAEKKDAIAFLLNFIVYYIVFTALETWFIHRWMNTLPQTPDKI